MKTGTRLIVLALCACVFALIAMKASAAEPPRRITEQHWQWQKWLPPVWKRIAKCETGLNWRHKTRDFEGAFGFRDTSWDSFKYKGFPADADMATPWQQYKVALRIHARYGFTGWGCYMNRSWVRYGR